MKKSQWNENEIKSLFSQLPTITDNRDPQKIYEKAIVSKTKKPINRWLTMTASAAVVCLLSFFTSNVFFQKDEMQKDSSNDSPSVAMYSNSSREEEKSSNMATESQNQEAKQVSEEDGQMAVQKRDVSNDVSVQSESERNKSDSSTGYSSALLYKEEMEKMNYVTVGASSLNYHSIVPVTLKVDEGITNPVEAIKEAETMINGDMHGLQVSGVNWNANAASGDQAVNITFSINPKEVIDVAVFESLKETYRYQNVNKLYFYTNDNKGVTFSHVGLVEETDIDSTPQRAIYLLQSDEKSSQLFIPSTNEYKDISEALEVMKSEGNSTSMKASIPATVQFESLVGKGNRLFVTFSANTKLKDNEQYVKAIQAILLTAREFGYKTIQFQNSNINTIGTMKLNEVMEVPIAPNVINP
ncbi:GerMN domain-containing protein [Bacillus massiliigorillae]|uniref:GerMN domain-containing protein n=1 Tax=Bacillus massiliigorillae TaxID=1243664 RepID=UPI00039C162A|nr:GerMN domain-containing protein [Bacillus massiliigorillae]